MSSELSSPPCVLFIDDDKDVQKAAAMLLPRRGFDLVGARNPEEAWSVLAGQAIDVVLLDLNFQPGSTSGAEGFRCLEAILAHDPDMVVVIVTGHSGINIAVAAMRAGAADFVMKPWSNDRLVATLHDAAELGRQRRQARGSVRPDPAEAAGDEGPVIGESAAMERVGGLLRRAVATDAPVLLIGDAGTGKSLLAQRIHRLSSRGGHGLAWIEPATIWAEGEAEFAAALKRIDTQGTLFLDEIGGLPSACQARLLGFLRQHPGLRVISATRQKRRSLQAGARQAGALQAGALQEGAVHADLLCRLNIIEIAIPPLRERTDDIMPIAQHFLRLFARRYERGPMEFSPTAADAIAGAPWPGNVRALRQAIERAVVLAPAPVLRPEDIPDLSPLPESIAAELAVDDAGGGDLNLARSEKAIVAAALRRHGFNVSHAAKELGLARATLYRRMARHGL